MNKAAWLVMLLSCTGTSDTSDTDTKDTDTDTADADADADADTDTDTDTDSDTETETLTVPTPEGDPATIALAGECPLDTKLGAFAVQVLDTYSTISGSIADGVVPITILELMEASGDCELLRRNNAFCDPPCDVGETCNFDGECIPFPLAQDIGGVTIGGVVSPVVLRPVQPGNTYFERDTPHPAYEPGSLIEMRTWGTTFGSDIVLHGVGVQLISLGQSTDWTLFRDQDFEVTWEPPTGTVRSEVHLRLNIDQHGNTPVSLFCKFGDDGTGTVPASLITRLIDFGVTGFPNATVTRRTVDSTEIGGGCAQFEVTSPTEPNVLVNGYIPCSGPQDCPPPQSCNTVTFICE